MIQSREEQSDAEWRAEARAYLEKQQYLLQIEQECDQADLNSMLEACNFWELEARKRAINLLQVVNVETYFFGHLVLRLKRRLERTPGPQGRTILPPTKLTRGDPVNIYQTEDMWAGTPLATGMVYKVTPTELLVEISSGDYIPMEGLTVVKVCVDGAYAHYRKGLQEFANPSGPVPYLSKVILGVESPRSSPRVHPLRMPDLNPKQKEAIIAALAENDLAIIQGPPGTGKTRVLADYIAQVRSSSQGVGSREREEGRGLCPIERGG